MRNKLTTSCLILATALLVVPALTVDAQPGEDDGYEQMMQGGGYEEMMSGSEQGQPAVDPNAIWECSNCNKTHTGDSKDCPNCGAIFTETKKKPNPNGQSEPTEKGAESEKEKKERLKNQATFYAFLMWGMRITFILVNAFIIAVIVNVITKFNEKKRQQQVAQQSMRQAAIANQTGPRHPGAVFESRRPEEH